MVVWLLIPLFASILFILFDTASHWMYGSWLKTLLLDMGHVIFHSSYNRFYLTNLVILLCKTLQNIFQCILKKMKICAALQFIIKYALSFIATISPASFSFQHIEISLLERQVTFFVFFLTASSHIANSLLPSSNYSPCFFSKISSFKLIVHLLPFLFSIIWRRGGRNNVSQSYFFLLMHITFFLFKAVR